LGLQLDLMTNKSMLCEGNIFYHEATFFTGIVNHSITKDGELQIITNYGETI